MEMLIKMIAMGVSNAPQAYLSDYWNRLDCFIVIAGGLEYVLDIGNVNLTAIRTVRVLRPLRAINRIPSKYNFTYMSIAVGRLFKFMQRLCYNLTGTLVSTKT